MKKGGVAFLLVLALLMSLCVVVEPVLAVAEDSWVSKASMNEARAGLGVTVVNGKIYAIGGRTGMLGTGDRIGLVGTNEAYDPSTDTWEFVSSMPTARASFGIAVYQNKIYCIGGHVLDGSAGASTGANEVYDPITDTWENRSSMPTPGKGVHAEVVNDKIYAVGGNSNVTYCYDPATDTWTIKTLMPATPYLLGSWSCSSTVVDNKIFVVGVDFHEVYDSSIDTWNSLTPKHSGAYYGTAAATTGGNSLKRIYVFGADMPYWSLNSPNFTSQSYDPETDSWSACASMPTGRINAAVAVVNDQLYVIGGETTSFGFNFDASAVNEMYTPIGYGTPDSTYQSASPSPLESSTPQSATLPAELIYASAGTAIIIIVIAVVAVYLRKRK